MHKMSLFSLIAVLLLSSACNPAHAIDPAFGSAGFAAIPKISSGTTVSVLGFVRLPLSGGYMVFSQQQDSRGTQRVVASRFTDDGQINRGWGDSGNLFYAMPVPIGLNARVAIGLEGSPAAEQIYLTGLVSSGGDISYFVATFNAAGSFTSFSTSGPGGWPSGSVYNVEAEEIYSATAGVTLLGGNQGLLVAGAGYNNRWGTPYESWDIFQVYGSPRVIDIYDFFAPSREGSRISQLRSRSDGRADVVGTFGYRLFQASSWPASPIYASIPVPCPGGATPLAKSVDDIAWPDSFAGDALLYARSICPGSSNTYVSILRMRGIDVTPTIPVVVWSTMLADVSTACGGGSGTFDSFGGCVGVYLGVSNVSGAPVIASSLTGSLARIDVGSTSPKSLGNITDTSGVALIPSSIYGADYRYPYLVCLARSGGAYGLVRVDVR